MDIGEHKRRYFVIANKFQKKILILVFCSAIILLLITVISLFFVIFTILTAEIPHREILVFNIRPAAIKAATAVLTVMPLVIFMILLLAYRVSNKLVGPLGRLYRELDKRIQENSKEHIFFRKNDDLQDLTQKINTLLDKLPEK